MFVYLWVCVYLLVKVHMCILASLQTCMDSCVFEFALCATHRMRTHCVCVCMLVCMYLCCLACAVYENMCVYQHTCYECVCTWLYLICLLGSMSQIKW